MLTEEERAVLDTLAYAWNKFLLLPKLHPWEQQEFMHAIHQAQNIIMSRPAMREEVKEANHVR